MASGIGENCSILGAAQGAPMLGSAPPTPPPPPSNCFFFKASVVMLLYADPGARAEVFKV